MQPNHGVTLRERDVAVTRVMVPALADPPLRITSQGQAYPLVELVPGGLLPGWPLFQPVYLYHLDAQRRAEATRETGLS